MQQINSSFHLVDVLAAGAAGAGGADLQVARIDLHFDWIGLGHHRHRGRGGVHPALGFGGRNSLDPMHAGLELQAAVDPLSPDRKDQFLVAAQIGFGGADRLHLPTAALGIALVHAGQISCPEAGFIAAGPGPDFQHDAALIAGIRRQQGQGEAPLQLVDARFERLQLADGQFHQLRHGGIVAVLLEQPVGVQLLLLQLAPLLVVEHQGLKPGPFASNGLQPVRVRGHSRIGQLPFKGREGVAGRLQAFAEQGRVHGEGRPDAAGTAGEEARKLSEQKPDAREASGSPEGLDVWSNKASRPACWRRSAIEAGQLRCTKSIRR